MGLFISCEEATIICSKAQYNEATLLEKVKLNIHILQCKICARFAKQNGKLTEVCGKHLHKPNNEHTLSKQEKEIMKEKIRNTN